METTGVLRGVPYPLAWSQFPAAAPLLEALAANAIDTGFAGDAPTTFALAASADARIIAAIRMGAGDTAILVLTGSPIRRFADFACKRVATGRGSICHFLILALARANGLPLDSIEIVPLLPSDGRAALVHQPPAIARQVLNTEHPVLVPIDDSVIAAEQATADLWAAAGVIPWRG